MFKEFSHSILRRRRDMWKGTRQREREQQSWKGIELIKELKNQKNKIKRLKKGMRKQP